MEYGMTVAERLMRYVRMDTQSDAGSDTCPSTEKQKVLSRLLVEELLSIGLSDAGMDDNGYVYATIPSNTDRQVPVICLCAHVDTAPDCSGTDVKPILHRAWDGSPIVLPDDPTQVIRIEDHPYLAERVGDDIVTASGTTLLGADDKAGVAVIMEVADFLMRHPEVRHGKVRILFTPDEEIGRGVDRVDLGRLGADFGYTLDGSERGSLEDETFSADSLEVTIQGVSAHPGSAKGKMVSALKIAAAFIDSLPKVDLSPETTDGREGFVHPTLVTGSVETARVEFILRDFRTARLDDHHALLERSMEEVVKAHPGASFSMVRKEQYRNMKEVLDRHPEVVAHAEEAIRRCGMEVRRNPVRGGTDGSRLSFMGLPCPNLFTGEMALHSRQEYVSVQDMRKSVQTVVELLRIWEERASDTDPAGNL
jgi:tripeptide aminopeptidase